MYEVYGTVKSIEAERRTGVTSSWGGRNGEFLFLWIWSVCDEEKVLETDGGTGCTTK